MESDKSKLVIGRSDSPYSVEAIRALAESKPDDLEIIIPSSPIANLNIPVVVPNEYPFKMNRKQRRNLKFKRG